MSSDFSDLDASQVLPADWHVGGKVSGHLVYTGDLDRFEHGEVTGSVKIAGAAFDMANLFVTLHQLAKFGGLNDVRIDSIETHLRYHEHQLELSDIRASYQDQIRVEGAGTITPDRLDGRPAPWTFTQNSWLDSRRRRKGLHGAKRWLALDEGEYQRDPESAERRFNEAIDRRFSRQDDKGIQRTNQGRGQIVARYVSPMTMIISSLSLECRGY